MSDQQLLELAAMAAGIGPVLCYESARNCLRIGSRDSYRLWRPFTDHADAFRLAAALEHAIQYVTHEFPEDEIGVTRRTVDVEATCRGIVIAAANYGEFMQGSQ